MATGGTTLRLAGVWLANVFRRFLEDGDTARASGTVNRPRAVRVVKVIAWLRALHADPTGQPPRASRPALGPTWILSTVTGPCVATTAIC